MNQPDNVRQASEIPQHLMRYARQMRYPGVGVEGQQRLLASRALIVGCGALGSVLANTLARAGVGKLRIVDRDFLEYTNLQRQDLYDERDVESGLPKAVIAADKLRRINSEIEIQPMVADVDHANIQSLCEDVAVILDGTDNFETRFLINDASVKLNIPWVYGGCLGCDGQSMTILPGETACLNCLMSDGPPPPGTTPTCDSAGILAPIIHVIAAIQSNEAIKILSGHRDQISRQLSVVELWDNRFRQLDVSGLREQGNCPTCKGRQFQWLNGTRGSHTAVLCGRNAVQVTSADRQPISLEHLEKRLAGLGQIRRNPFLLRFQIDDFVITAFPDGRAIITGTEEIATAKRLYAQYLGA